MRAMESGYYHSEHINVVSLNPQLRLQGQVKITLWRFANACLLLGLGTTKAVLAFQDNPGADTVDMALGLIWAFM